MAKYKVMFARFPGNYSDGPHTTQWLLELESKLAKESSDIEGYNWWRSDTPIPMVRNLAVRQAMGSGMDYLLMIDSDMQPDCEVGHDPLAKEFWPVAWDHMMRHLGEPCAIAAPYVGPPPLENIYVFHWMKHESSGTGIGPDGRFSLEQYSINHAAMMTGVCEVAALPTGLILYDMRVFRGMPKPFFYYEYKDEWQTEKASTEDVTQTRDMSLAWHMSGGKVGGRVYCAWDSWASHYKGKACRKPAMLPPEMVGERLRKALENPGGGERLTVVKSSLPENADSWISDPGRLERDAAGKAAIADSPMRGATQCTSASVTQGRVQFPTAWEEPSLKASECVDSLKDFGVVSSMKQVEGLERLINESARIALLEDMEAKIRAEQERFRAAEEAARVRRQCLVDMNTEIEAMQDRMRAAEEAALG